MRGVHLSVCLCACLLSPAFASDPPSPPSSPAPSDSTTSAATAAPAAQPNADAKPTPAASAAAAKITATTKGSQVLLVTSDPAAEAQIKRLRAAGYKPEVRNGEVYFCRSEATMGSRFEHKVCGTADALERAADEARRTIEDNQRRTMGPHSG
jgi:hypothetical protein